LHLDRLFENEEPVFENEEPVSENEQLLGVRLLTLFNAINARAADILSRFRIQHVISGTAARIATYLLSAWGDGIDERQSL
jgi:hypothetical protein